MLLKGRKRKKKSYTFSLFFPLLALSPPLCSSEREFVCLLYSLSLSLYALRGGFREKVFLFLCSRQTDFLSLLLYCHCSSITFSCLLLLLLLLLPKRAALGCCCCCCQQRHQKERQTREKKSFTELQSFCLIISHQVVQWVSEGKSWFKT